MCIPQTWSWNPVARLRNQSSPCTRWTIQCQTGRRPGLRTPFVGCILHLHHRPDHGVHLSHRSIHTLNLHVRTLHDDSCIRIEESARDHELCTRIQHHPLAKIELRRPASNECTCHTRHASDASTCHSWHHRCRLHWHGRVMYRLPASASAGVAMLHAGRRHNHHAGRAPSSYISPHSGVAPKVAIHP